VVVITAGGGVGEIEQQEGDKPQKPNIQLRGFNISAGCNCADRGAQWDGMWVVVITAGGGVGKIKQWEGD
jgi:hypothetical protein